jgi:hypothetical protein
VILGAALGIAGHLLAFGVGLLAARLVQPSAGGGFEDIAAAVVSFLGAELLVALCCLVGGGVLLARGRRDLGTGLLLGWLAGALAGGVWLWLRARSG